MQINGIDIPCGCDERKHIMFIQGNPDLQVLLIVGVPLILLAIGLYLKVKK